MTKTVIWGAITPSSSPHLIHLQLMVKVKKKIFFKKTSFFDLWSEFLLAEKMHFFLASNYPLFPVIFYWEKVYVCVLHTHKYNCKARRTNHSVHRIRQSQLSSYIIQFTIDFFQAWKRKKCLWVFFSFFKSCSLNLMLYTVCSMFVVNYLTLQKEIIL